MVRSRRATVLILLISLIICVLLALFVVKIFYDKQMAGQQTSWFKTYGGEQGFFINRTNDGGYVVTGINSSGYPGSFYIIKTDKNGTMQWENTYGASSNDYGRCVRQTDDGGYIATGGRVTYLIKTDSNGEELWEKQFGGSEGVSIQQTTDGGYILGASDMRLIKTDKNGNRLWEKTYGSGYSSELHSVTQTIDGGYIFTGIKNMIMGKGNLIVIKTDAHGKSSWEEEYSGNRGYSIVQTLDGGYIIVGDKIDENGTDLYLLKIDSLGDVDWEKTFGGDGFDAGFSGQQTTDGGYIAVGQTNSFNNGTNSFRVYVVKTDKNGNMAWNKTYNRTGDDYGFSITQATDGGCVITGRSETYGESPGGVFTLKLELKNNDAVGNMTLNPA